MRYLFYVPCLKEFFEGGDEEFRDWKKGMVSDDDEVIGIPGTGRFIRTSMMGYPLVECVELT